MAYEPTIDTIMIRHVVTVHMDDTLEQIRDTFDRFRFHHLLVQEKGTLVGVISDRDLLKNLSPFVGKMAERQQDVASLKRRAHQIMTRTLVAVPPDMPIVEAGLMMLQRGVSCLPVTNAANECVGIVTWRDLLRWCMTNGGCARPADEDRPAA